MLDQVAEFAQRLPAWVGSDGFPLSYRHFIYGMKWIARNYARESIRIVEATSAAQYDKSAYADWMKLHNSRAGYT